MNIGVSLTWDGLEAEADLFLVGGSGYVGNPLALVLNLLKKYRVNRTISKARSEVVTALEEQLHSQAMDGVWSYGNHAPEPDELADQYDGEGDWLYEDVPVEALCPGGCPTPEHQDGVEEGGKTAC